MSGMFREHLDAVLRCQTVVAFALSGFASVGCQPHDSGVPAKRSDTLAQDVSVSVHVRNPQQGSWGVSEGWRIVEELRIGDPSADGPTQFSEIVSFTVDDRGRFWVLDMHAQELRVFDSEGEHVRTIGGRGLGPAEFGLAVRVDIAPDGSVWVMDPGNMRLSVFDTAGAFLGSRFASGGFMIRPWPGGFDREGRYYSPIRVNGGGTQFALRRGSVAVDVRADQGRGVSDTVQIPQDPVQRPFLEYAPSAHRRIRATIPFQGSIWWTILSSGALMALVTDEYRLVELNPNGDTLRIITREYTPLPITGDDCDWALRRLAWFVNEGGRFRCADLPDKKPGARSFFVGGEGHIWVEVAVDKEEYEGKRWDVFDRDGRYLGEVNLAFSLARVPSPILRNRTLYGVTTDEWGVPYLIRSRLVIPMS